MKSVTDGVAEAESDHSSLLPTLDLELQFGRATIRLFNTITTFGTPQDVGLQELRIEMSFPSDAEADCVSAYPLL